MRAPRFLVLAATLTLGAAALGAQRQLPVVSPPSGQGLLGAGQNTPVPMGADAFFDDNVLHEIRLLMNARDWQALKDNYLENTYYPTDFQWRSEKLRNVGIRSRGNGSRSGVKPGLRVDFDRYTTDQKFLGLKSFVLRNNTQDPSSMHERVSMLLFRRLGLPAPREAHVRMYVNDVYEGLFTIVESVDKVFLSKAFGEDSGHLFKYDYPPDQVPYFFEDKGSNADAYVPLPFKPETRESDPQGQVLAQFVQAVNQSSDATYRSAVAPFMDLRKFLRHVAVEVFVADYDGFIGNYGINNFYWYRFTNQNLFTFIPWDKSEAFSAGPESTIFHNINGVPDSRRNRLMSRTLADKEMLNYFLDTLLEIARSVVEPAGNDSRGWMEREVAREYDQIRAAALADTTKPFSNDQFEAAVVALTDFARRRSDLVTAEVNATPR
jgi:spore coat protein CotH